MYSENYLRWVKEEKITGLTRTQRLFAEWCLSNSITLQQIGNLEDIFTSVRRFIKYSSEFVAVEIKDEKENIPVTIEDTWPTADEETRFDWGMSMKQIDQKYKQQSYGKDNKEKRNSN